MCLGAIRCCIQSPISIGFRIGFNAELSVWLPRHFGELCLSVISDVLVWLLLQLLLRVSESSAGGNQIGAKFWEAPVLLLLLPPPRSYLLHHMKLYGGLWRFAALQNDLGMAK